MKAADRRNMVAVARKFSRARLGIGRERSGGKLLPVSRQKIVVVERATYNGERDHHIGNSFCGLVFAILVLMAPESVADEMTAQNTEPEFVETTTGMVPSLKFVERFDCGGAILHQPLGGKQESPLKLWFGVDEELNVSGAIDIAKPLDLAETTFVGKLGERMYDPGEPNRLIFGKLAISLPYVLEEKLLLRIMRETLIPHGPPTARLSIRFRASNHSYVTGMLHFATNVNPDLKKSRAAFISVTCTPETDTSVMSGTAK